MAPIPQLVLSANQRYVAIPPRPSDPPTDADVLLACCVTRDLLAHHGKSVHLKSYNAFLILVVARGGVDPQDMSHAARYEQRFITAAHGGDPPEAFGPNFQLALQQNIANIIQQAVNDALPAAIAAGLAPFGRELGKVRRLSALTYNHNTGNNDLAVLEVVPFPNGDDPTAEPSNLPALTSAAAVRALSRNDQRTYFAKYHGRPATRQDDIVTAILRAIGSRA